MPQAINFQKRDLVYILQDIISLLASQVNLINIQFLFDFVPHIPLINCEPFYTNKETGTGLGLMVSQQIIANHKGSMVFESELGKGTTVEIILPMS